MLYLAVLVTIIALMLGGVRVELAVIGGFTFPTAVLIIVDGVAWLRKCR